MKQEQDDFIFEYIFMIDYIFINHFSSKAVGGTE